ncbi:hypothetical protein HY024_02015 [Candidatus Curtissbacteria bacterium]|nr:hypothetical protein [Candidatus Curtissbacteria bacterium]
MNSDMSPEIRTVEPVKRVDPSEIRNPYEASSLVRKLNAQKEAGISSPIVLFVDLDGTFEDPNPNGSPNIPERIRQACDLLNIPVVAVTSRSEEMTFSAEDYEKTKASGQIKRPKARLKQIVGPDGKKRFEVASPEEIPAFRGQYSFDAVAAQTGAVIYTRQQDTGAYVKDKEYEAGSKFDETQWREKVLPVVTDLITDHETGERLSTLLPIEDAANYENGSADVFPLEWRIQLDFKADGDDGTTLTTGATDSGTDNKIIDPAIYASVGLDPEKLTPQTLTAEEAIAKKQEFKNRIKKLRDSGVRIFPFGLIDDSNPEKGRATVYVVRKHASKQKALKRILDHIGMSKFDISSIYCGDSFTDLLSLEAFYKNPRAAVLLVGDSRLTKTIEDALSGKLPDPRWAGQSIRSLIRRLRDTDDLGVRTLGEDGPKLITGGVRYDGSQKSETIAAYLLERIKGLPINIETYRKVEDLLKSAA